MWVYDASIYLVFGAIIMGLYGIYRAVRRKPRSQGSGIPPNSSELPALRGRDPALCTSCHRQNKKGDRFCEQCGAELK